jgi:hypothetical protein
MLEELIEKQQAKQGEEYTARLGNVSMSQR